MLRIFIKLFVAINVLLIFSMATAQTCPATGSITLLCHETSNGLSLTGCYNQGLTYLCTTNLNSCSGVNSNSIATFSWGLPLYNAKKMRFTCPGQGASHSASRIALNAARWKNVAANAQRKGQVCPADKMPVLCRQQSKGVSLIGCHGGGLAYLCGKEVASCDNVNNKSVAHSMWSHANYDDKKLIFVCAGTRTQPIKKRVKLHTEVWDNAVANAR